MGTLKLCTAPTLDGLCGNPSPSSRCEQHPWENRNKRPNKATREARGYDHNWRRLSQRARELQPWCSHCGTTDDLTADHLQWPARTLRDVDVLCRPCNSTKGAPTPENDPRGKTLNPGLATPGRQENQLTQWQSQSAWMGSEDG